MNYDEIFKKAYLKQLNIINENELINNSGNSSENSSTFSNSSVSDLTDVANGKDVDADGQVSEEKLTEEDIDELDDNEELPLQKVCFVTTDQVLIDALNSGFEEVVFFVNAKDEETGEDKIEEVKFGKDSFGELEISAADEDSESDEIDEFEECKAPIEEEDNASEEDNEKDSKKPNEECNQLNECNKLLNELKEKRNTSKYGPY